MNLISGPLQGRLILDCSILAPGPWAGKLLARLGARVIKVESPLRPDPARKHAQGSWYEELNREKELLLLDLTSSSDRTTFNTWVRQADALIEGYLPETKKKLGLDATTLHAINPRLEIASLVAYSETGPESERPAHDLNLQAQTGSLAYLGDQAGLPIADLLAGYEASLRVAAALDKQSRAPGPGQRQVISLRDTLQLAQGKYRAEARITGVQPGPEAQLVSGLYPCYRIYKTQEGQRLAVGALENRYWERFCGVLGRPDLIEKAFVTGPERDEIVADIQKTLKSRPWKAWEPLFEAANCCVDLVRDYSEQC